MVRHFPFLLQVQDCKINASEAVHFNPKIQILPTVSSGAWHGNPYRYELVKEKVAYFSMYSSLSKQYIYFHNQGDSVKLSASSDTKWHITQNKEEIQTSHKEASMMGQDLPLSLN